MPETAVTLNKINPKGGEARSKGGEAARQSRVGGRNTKSRRGRLPTQAGNSVGELAARAV